MNLFILAVGVMLCFVGFMCWIEWYEFRNHDLPEVDKIAQLYFRVGLWFVGCGSFVSFSSFFT